MSNNKTRKLTKQELKELIKTVIDESNYFHDKFGEFSSEKDATSLSRNDIGQYEYPSKKDAFPCGRLSPKRDWCKKGKKPQKSVIEGSMENISDDFKDELRSMIAQEIEKAIAEWIIEDEDPPSLSLPGGGHQNPENKSHGKINEPYETQYRRSSSKKNAQKKRPK